jgi:Uma2 family endonuclease
MLAVLEEPAIRARVPAMSVEHYHRMFELGMIAENAELIRGAIVEKTPKTPLHSSIVVLLHRHLLQVLPTGWHPRSEQPLTFSDSEPEPDIAVVKGTERDYFGGHPTSAGLVIEVCVTSEAIDRVKLEVYAEAGIPECWLILAEERVFERHTDPQGGRYKKSERATFPATLESIVLPGLKLPPPEIFRA